MFTQILFRLMMDILERITDADSVISQLMDQLDAGGALINAGFVADAPLEPGEKRKEREEKKV